MKSKKLQLDTIRIKSFVTDLNPRDKKDIKGGLIGATQENTILAGGCESGDDESSGDYTDTGLIYCL